MELVSVAGAKESAGVDFRKGRERETRCDVVSRSPEITAMLPFEFRSISITKEWVQAQDGD